MKLEIMRRAVRCTRRTLALPYVVAALMLAAELLLPSVSSAAACKPTVTETFNGSCNSDVLLQNVNGQYVMWFMNGTAIGSSGQLINPGSGWTIQAYADFNGDGDTDILWQNSSSGTYAIWLMNGSTISNSGSPGTPGLNWTVVGVGHFDTSGRSGIVLQDRNTGAVAIWNIDATGLAIASSAIVATPGVNWTVQGIGDFDGNGTSDILLRDSNTGNVAMWLMNGTTISSTGVLASTLGFNWSIQGVGDFDGNSKSDILWRDSSSGAVAVWLMNGTTIASTGIPGEPPSDSSTVCCVGQGNGWTIEGVGDFDGNGM